MDDGGRESNNAGQSTNWHSPVVLSAIELRKKEGRGKLLSTLIILYGISVLVGIPSYVLYSVVYPPSFNLSALLLGILEGILLLGIWKWKKIAIYGFLVLLIVPIALALIAFIRPLTTSESSYISVLLNPSDVFDTTFWVLSRYCCLS